MRIFDRLAGDTKVYSRTFTEDGRTHLYVLTMQPTTALDWVVRLVKDGVLIKSAQSNSKPVALGTFRRWKKTNLPRRQLR